MANWTLPTLASTYANYTAELDGRLKDLAYGLDPAIATVTSPPTNTIRWSSAVSKWQKYDGTTWNNLAATYDINVTSATKWSSTRTIAASGDVTGTSSAWDGSGNATVSLTLATVNSNVGSFGSATVIPVITVNGKGLVTAVGTANIGTIAAQAANSVAITGGAISATSLTLVQSTTAAPTVEGRMEWDTDNDTLMIGDGTGTKTFAPINATVTLTNHTLGTGCVWGGNAVPVANGGTGAGDAATARSNLGLTALATQAASSVAITGGAISGTSLTLVQSTTAAPTVEGRMEWDTDNDTLMIGTGAATATFAPLNATVTLTNHTLGTNCTWSGNTVAVGNGGTGATTFTAGGLLVGNGAGAVGIASAAQITAAIGPTAVTNATNATNATHITGGAVGTLHYQSAAGVTAQLAAGTSGYFLKANGAAAPTWVDPATMVVGTAGALTTANSYQVAKLGIGVNSPAWGGAYVAVDLWTSSAWGASGEAGLAVNMYRDSTGWVSRATGEGSRYSASYTGHFWHYSPTVTGAGVARTLTQTMTLNNTGDLTTLGNMSAYSDRRLKESFENIWGALDLVDQLQGVFYKRKGQQARQLGFVAQDVQRVVPEVVSEDADGMLSVAYGNITALLIEAIKELRQEIRHAA